MESHVQNIEIFPVINVLWSGREEGKAWIPVSDGPPLLSTHPRVFSWATAQVGPLGVLCKRDAKQVETAAGIG